MQPLWRPPSTNRGARGRSLAAALARTLGARVLARVGRLALPQRCILCGGSCSRSGVLSCDVMSHRPICAGCDAAYWNEPRLRCRMCALPLAPRGAGLRGEARYLCPDCTRVRPPFDRTLTLADYRAPLEQLALSLKFGGRLLIAREFAQGLARVALDNLAPDERPDVLAPVPLAHARLVERGFNQAWEIAKPLARWLALPADATLMRRHAYTAPQSRLDLDARRRNVEAAFAVMRPVRGAHVALVDDVMTSGATLAAAARALKAAGARQVTNFVALRTPKD
jgi:ComF family protein